MAKWLVEARKVTTFYLEVEAHSPELAQEIAGDEELDAWSVQGSDDMEIVGVYHG
jgi:hypothetical protein